MTKIQPGQSVWVRLERVRKPLGALYQGPYRYWTPKRTWRRSSSSTDPGRFPWPCQNCPSAHQHPAWTHKEYGFSICQWLSSTTGYHTMVLIVLTGRIQSRRTDHFWQGRMGSHCSAVTSLVEEFVRLGSHCSRCFVLTRSFEKSQFVFCTIHKKNQAKSQDVGPQKKN